MVRLAVLVAVLVVLLSACAHVPVVAPAAVTPAAPWYGDLHALAEEAAAVREMKLTQQFEVVPLEDETFFATWDDILRSSSTALQRELDETLKDFTGVDSHGLAAIAERANQVRQEQLIAFYHFATHRLVVRKTIPAVLAAGGERVRFAGLAHEVGHVLQDQLGAGAWVPGSFDEAIAWRALLEGDATLTATLLDGAKHGLSPTRAVERARITLSTLSTAQVLEASGLSPKLLDAPPVVRELFLFPYFRGQRFVADLYQAGGLELVRRAFEHPPQRSDAIFSPQRWLDGSAPPLQPLNEPPRRLGLLLLRTLIEQCQRGRSGTPTLQWVEAHYLDDSFRRVGRVLSWATEWDSPDRSTARIATDLLTCLGVRESDVEVATREEVVGVVAGAPSADRERLAAAAARTAKLEAVPAMSGQHIPTPSLEVAFRPAGHGIREGDVWTHAKLGLRLSLPGARLADNPGAALTAIAPGAALLVVFVDEPPTPRSDDTFVNAVLDAFLRSSKLVPEGFPLGTSHEWKSKDLGWLTARETRGEYDGPTALKALVLPVCGGKASVNVVALGFSAAGQRTADAWVSTLQGMLQPPICSDP